MTAVPSVFAVADRYIERVANVDPIFATHLGVPGTDDRLTDYSPVGVKAIDHLDHEFLAFMEETEPLNDEERITRTFFLERLSGRIARHEAGEEFRNLNVTWSPIQLIRSVFELMPRDTTDHWRLVAKRMAEVPWALDGVIATLREGQARGWSAARRQALACATQARVWSGAGNHASRYFGGLAADYVGRGGADRKLAEALTKAADRADAAYAALAVFLTDEYAPAAPDADGVGAERYGLATGHFLGATIDVEETYAWGWQELASIRREITELCNELCPKLSFRESVEELNTQYGRVLQGDKALKDWLEAFMARTIVELNGKHFDIPLPLQRLEVRIAPPGGSAAQYYVGPSEDFVRPGTYWYPANGRNHFPIWSEISTAYHEGVPGHHLQIGYARCLGDRLSRFQRSIMVSGHAEGWALYAERLMDEFGYLDRPEYRLNMLINAAFRAAGVVIDIGLHLNLAIPTDQQVNPAIHSGAPFHPGEKWTPELALAFMMENSAQDEAYLRSEIDRYLGVPAQGISYKLGERMWLEAREEAKQRLGDDFDLKQFHMNALALGPMGLAQLKSELSRR